MDYPFHRYAKLAYPHVSQSFYFNIQCIYYNLSKEMNIPLINIFCSSTRAAGG